MNTQRIVTGGLLAGGVYFLLDYVINGLLLGSSWHGLQLAGYLKGTNPLAMPAYLLMDVGIGFILMWSYVLARPRLGPGPKTAFLMGTLAWFLVYAPISVNYALWFKIPSSIPVIYLLGGLVQCWVAIYLAGWQYIEKAP
ncbi:MAG: hypothetical protein A2992_08105 [Elusimicrobia bacterium RIFCSPLOWO2_01_FULL_59_12]|nr:MAG: hypothetical protein A2992_08105 [Elusimicrobia bacterium RIFCSPLOWO2_01_FULL_59_12]